MALIDASRAQCDVTVVSIFVNPTQFGPRENLSTFPRDFQRDEKLCRDAGVTIVFAPVSQEIYPAQFETFVEPGELAKPLCGAFRPGHFRGVATVVCKLFNMAQPDVAFFGQGFSAVCGRASDGHRSESADRDRDRADRSGGGPSRNEQP
ncbi:pantoate--beta-alanine ligase [Bradyrhizobium sp. GM5.1]